MKKLLYLLILIVAALLLGRIVWSSLKLAWTLTLVVTTYFLIRPELTTLTGWNKDGHPWLVRLREHRWRPVGWGETTLPRGVAYLLLAVAWYCTW